MSTAGTVPRQGATAEALTQARQQQLAEDKKKRGPMGPLGKGTPGSRVKAAWRRYNAAQGAPKHMITLKEFVRRKVWDKDLGDDVERWLESKRHRGGRITIEARKLRAERIAVLDAQRQAASSKTKMQVPKKETSRSAGRR